MMERSDMIIGDTLYRCEYCNKWGQLKKDIYIYHNNTQRPLPLHPDCVEKVLKDIKDE